MNRRERRVIRQAYRTGVLGNNQTHQQTIGILTQAAQQAIQGGQAAVQQFMQAQGFPQSGAWCGEFAAAIVRSTGGTPPQNPELASNWRNYGTPSSVPHPGDVAVRIGYSSRNPGNQVPTGEGGSHVTFVGGVDPRTGTFTGVGGNQGANRYQPTAISNYPISGFEFRTPPGAATPVPSAAPLPIDIPPANLNDPYGGNNLAYLPHYPTPVPDIPRYDIPLVVPPSFPAEPTPSAIPQPQQSGIPSYIPPQSNSAATPFATPYSTSSNVSISPTPPAIPLPNFTPPNEAYPYMPDNQIQQQATGGITGSVSEPVGAESNFTSAQQRIFDQLGLAPYGLGFSPGTEEPLVSFLGDQAAISNFGTAPIDWSAPQISSPGNITDNPFVDPSWLPSGQVPSSGEITDNPFANPQWTQPTSDSSPGTITDNPFSDPSWLPSQSYQPSPAQSVYDPSLGSIGQPGGVSTVQGTIVGDNGMYYRFDPATGTYQSTGIPASGSGAYGSGATGGFGVGAGSQYGVTASGFSTGYTPFGGGGVGPQFSGGGFVDTSTPAGLSHGGSDPSSGGSGGWVPPSAAAAFKFDAPGGSGKYATAQARHGG